MYVCTSIAGSPGAWHRVPSDLDVTKRGRTVALSYHKVRGGASSPRSLKQPDPGTSRSDCGCVATELHLNNYDNRTRSRRQVNSSGDSDFVATAMRMQCQANCPFYELPDPARRTAEAIKTRWLPAPPDKLQWHLPPGGNRTALKAVTVRPLPVNTLGLQSIEQS